MSYLVFARKFRPQTFDEVVQQDHVTRTLINAIDAGRVAHSILFAGPRGTGKTTVARILAKAMNCVNGPTSSPCNTCRSCREITGGHAADVFEIDGASNNSVDQVRELRENLKYMPAHSRYKIYIIDEVHMLSQAAFNALLKTLEEPPGHVLFMFATTEPHKIPVTILSRCQRHDLRRIDMAAIFDQMRRICDMEGAAIDDAGLSLIAQEAGGGMRDALSLLDHVLVCADGPVTADLVADLLGAAEHKHLFDLSAAVFSRDIQSVLQKIDTVWRSGLDMKRFFADLLNHFYHLLMVALGERTRQLVNVPAHEIDRMQTLVKQVPEMFLVQVIDLMFQAEPAIKLSSQPKLAIEMVFLKLFQAPPALPIDTLIERLDQLRGAVIDDRRGESNRAADGQGVPASSAPGRSEAISDAVAQSPLLGTPGAGSTLIDDGQLWDRAIRQVEQEKPSLAAVLKRCRINSIDDGRLALEISGNDFAYKNIQKHHAFLENMFGSLSGRSLTLDLVADTREAASKQMEKEEMDRIRRKALSHPMVMEALALFDGKVVDVKVS